MTLPRALPFLSTAPLSFNSTMAFWRSVSPVPTTTMSSFMLNVFESAASEVSLAFHSDSAFSSFCTPLLMSDAVASVVTMTCLTASVILKYFSVVPSSPSCASM
ncbi:Uncharacterised protein [uncultured archaeon]|nr:Uncharacterised protein [uncultured archaeon]